MQLFVHLLSVLNQETVDQMVGVSPVIGGLLVQTLLCLSVVVTWRKTLHPIYILNPRGFCIFGLFSLNIIWTFSPHRHSASG